ncbi:DUF742 domain-containing protein [Sphaerisporangium album]|uniref:DUF742 domain-containing protein n=1 Tax=Sphaerisporangium album TaxID=509200 RepID=A0A367FIG3_9ACTN|nr:DUF742 domain-containing protein [Sphaerisporangium album]RCG30168.1 DUF742 domain-containing protein [Sphaerisporangium album]
MEDPQWIDDGPVLRPYALTRGRTPPPATSFDLLCLIVSTEVEPPVGADLGPEHHRLLRLVRRARRLVELAADTDLPLGVLRLLLTDLQTHDLITAHPPATTAHPDPALLHEVLKGLQAL